ncbi:MAG TPA: transcription-repair coupling factor, partial [Legionellales bacterium]|nr:transcription-repair coupling factor [Legionellales bacterium]
GDVGFGKTEVAMRAAFLAVQNNKQVCILVPTTLLAGQHFENFQDRFAEFPITVDFLSRFRTAKETKQVLEKLAQGTVDIVIGTHKLFASPITFKNLGLLIIDEEHRFGVKQKEHLKALRLNVDILSMTATPIPRTLNMALAGIRDISIIATPPAKRLAIKTFWQQRQDNIIREALLREILRGGQVFFLHNNVQTIARIAEDLQALVPEAKISVAHGQMRERELEKIMSDFYHQRFNILVCTTIIETGIDIPTANTIIIDRADTFGLAQLHQLRGRVGRSHHQAYAYLLTPDEKLLNRDAIKRLEAIVSLENLGAGFMLATHDMEIRGTGELLGEEQSGNIQAVGFSLFMEMLDKAVNDLKSGKTPELAAPIQDSVHIELNVSAILPEHYIGDIHTRLIMYKRIANAKHQTQLRDLQIEMIDRFGLLPDAAKNLLAITELKLLAIKIGVLKITATQQKGRIEFNQTPLINPATLIKLIQQQSTLYQLDGPSCLRFTLNQTSALAKIAEVNSLLEMLGQE